MLVVVGEGLTRDEHDVDVFGEVEVDLAGIFKNTVFHFGCKLPNLLRPLKQYTIGRHNHRLLLFFPPLPANLTQKQHTGRLPTTHITSQYRPLHPHLQTILNLIRPIQLMIIRKRIKVEARIEQRDHRGGLDGDHGAAFEVEHPADLLLLVGEQDTAFGEFGGGEGFVVFGGTDVTDCDFLLVL